MNLSNLAAGTYTLTARAIDGQGAQIDSATRTVTVSDANLAPTVSISAPAAGANFATAPAGFALSANASAGEVNGWIQRVEFFINGNLVNTDTAGPWSFNVAGLANGTYTLTAKAVDQLNAETMSAPITITVGPQAKLHFIHVDHLNTPRLVTNDQQQAVWRWDQQEPFGVSVPDENPSNLGSFELPLRFSGQYADKETNLFFNYFRDYDPVLGRYEQSDPVGLRAGLNTYLYVNANPMSYADFFGLASEGMGSYLGGLGAKVFNGLGVPNQLSLPGIAGQNAAAKLCKKFQGRTPINLFDECTTECLSQQGDTPLVSGWLNKCIESCQNTFPTCNKPAPGACLIPNNS